MTTINYNRSCGGQAGEADLTLTTIKLNPVIPNAVRNLMRLKPNKALLARNIDPSYEISIIPA